MTMDLQELYQTVLLDHSRRPRNRGDLEGATHHAAGTNPSCGDEIALHAIVNPNGIVECITFTGQGCAISQASASLLTLKVRGKPAADALALERRVHGLLTGGLGEPDAADSDAALGDLAALGGVRQFPQRVKCAALAWNALRSLLETDAPRPATAHPAQSA